MEELFSGKTLTTFGYLKPKGDIPTLLKQQIDTDIETLYQVSCQARTKRSYSMHDYKFTARTGIHLELHATLKYLKV